MLTNSCINAEPSRLVLAGNSSDAIALLCFCAGCGKSPAPAVASMTWPHFPESITPNFALFLVEFKLLACWACRAEKGAYIDMP